MSTSTRWPLGIRIRPPVDRDAPHVEVADTVTGRRFRWSPDALSAYILRGRDPDASSGPDALLQALEAGADRAALAPGWRHWQDRGWYPSDQYYTASRQWRYADIDDGDRAIRGDVLSGYLETDGPPVDELLPSGRVVPLPDPVEPPAQLVSHLLVTRRSGRAYVPRPVPADRLSGLLWYGLAQIRARRERTTPDRPLSYLDSFGSAWDFHLCVFGVEGIEPGAYRYDIRAHQLIEVRPGDHRAEMARILQGMWSPSTAAWTLGMVADFPRYQWRYRHEHGLRRLYFESGIIGQELIVLAGAYGLSTLVTPAQQDSPYLALHGLDTARYAPVYTLTMGLSRGSAGVDYDGDAG